MKKDTLITHAGRDPGRFEGMVNPPVYRTSTVLFDGPEGLARANADRYAGTTYGRYGTPTTFALEEALAVLEGGHRAILVPGGLAAVTFTLQALLRPGDHVLVADTVYGPTRRFCDRHLAAMGIGTTYFDPCIGAGIERLFTDRTRLVFCESPGSLTFEVQDIPAITAVAHAHGALVAADNTWATPLGMAPFALGLDVSIHSATKYIGGHSDLMMGTITTAEEPLWRRLRNHVAELGVAVSPDDCYLALRGLRTLGARLPVHAAGALRIAHWLKGHPRVERVMYPPLPDDPGHALWQRDFTAACGLFAVQLRDVDDAAMNRLLAALKLFGLGYSWGGYESLALPCAVGRTRTATAFTGPDPILRLHIGLEDPDDLLADLHTGLSALG